MKDEFLDIVIKVKSLITGKITQNRIHYKISERENMLSNITRLENPNFKGRVELQSVAFCDFMGSKYNKKYNKNTLYLIDGYNEALDLMEIKWGRNSKIDKLLK